jgi:processive 1,2-diacylglycerol beta-glucosyltransferase
MEKGDEMKGLFLYITAGKGHQTPAEALRDAMISLGYQAVSMDMFDLMQAPRIKQQIERNWRMMLRHPTQERLGDSLADTKFSGKLITTTLGLVPKMRDRVIAYVREYQPDFILGTHFLIGPMIAPIIRKFFPAIPVYAYAPDIFYYPIAGSASKYLDRVFVTSTIGRDWCYHLGFSGAQVSLCPFPLKKVIEETKPLPTKVAREKLGLKERFTILFNLGGEGIGNTRLVRVLAKRNFSFQVVILGMMSKDTAKRYAKFRQLYPSFPLYTPGFVTNMQDWLCACDIQIGKAGANAQMEAMYYHKPFIITEMLYPAEKTADFFAQHEVGWIENNVRKQADLLERYATDTAFRRHVAKEMRNVPIAFGSKQFARQIIGDTIKDAGDRQTGH